MNSTSGSSRLQRDTDMVHGGVKRGTHIICYLKEDQSEFLEERLLKDLAKKHSEFIDRAEVVHGEVKRGTMIEGSC